MGSFLDNLKNAVEKGEFNSETAKKFNEVLNKAEEKSKLSLDELENNIKNRTDSGSTEQKKTLSKEEIEKVNKEYKKKMQEIAEEEKRNAIIATLKHESDKIEDYIVELYSLIKNTELSYNKNDEKNKYLFEEIENIKKKYKSIIDYNELINN